MACNADWKDYQGITSFNIKRSGCGENAVPGPLPYCLDEEDLPKMHISNLFARPLKPLWAQAVTAMHLYKGYTVQPGGWIVANFSPKGWLEVYKVNR
ncbi:hypothetical protein FKM82_000867 [Ascaphus truei]